MLIYIDEAGRFIPGDGLSVVAPSPYLTRRQDHVGES
jgi:hypothetical protein